MSSNLAHFYCWLIALCFLNNQSAIASCSNNTQCAIDEVCTEDPFSPDFFRCRSCYDCLRDQKELGIEEENKCGDTCSCENHDDCGEGLFCSSHPRDNIKFCQRCQRCLFPYGSTNPLGGICPEKCTCFHSFQCGTDKYCSNLGANQQENFLPDRHGVCTDCSFNGCRDLWLTDPVEDSCREGCPSQHECDRHSDCGTEGQWCSVDHKCNPCSAACLPRTAIPQYFFGQQHDLVSIDGSCPESCCDWGRNVTVDNQTFVFPSLDLPFLLGPCDNNNNANTTTNVVEAYYWNGNRLEASAEEFVDRGIKCEMERYELEDIFPRSVTWVYCGDGVPRCQRLERTVAILERTVNATTNATEEVRFTDSQENKFVGEIDSRSDSCALDDLLRGLLIGGIILACLIAFGCCYYLFGCRPLHRFFVGCITCLVQCLSGSG